MTIAEKVKLLDMLKEGRKFAAVARDFGVNESTIRYIYKDEAKIRKTAAITFNKSAKRVVMARNKTIVRMEAALAVWIADCRKKNIALDMNIIQTKARSLCETFATKEPEDDSGERKEAEEDEEDIDDPQPEMSSHSPRKKLQFSASKGWFAKFQKRYGLKSASLHGEAASADTVAAETYVNETFKKIISEGEYQPEQAWITKMLTSNWFHQCFIPQVKVYLAEKGMPFKVLLIMDNAGGHATDLSYSGVQVEFLPPNMTSLILPMDQGVIRAFKALYTRNALANLVAPVDAAQEDDDFNLKAYWRQYTIATCLQNIHKALEEMKPATINASWKKLWPEVVYDDKGFTPAEIQHSAVQKAVQLAAILGGEVFADMTTGNVDELLDCHSQPLTDEDLEELTKSASEEEEEAAQQETEVVSQTGLTLERLARLCNLAKELQERWQEWDDDTIRSVQFCNMVNDVMAPYKMLFDRKKKQRQQLPITMFLQPRKKEPVPAAATMVTPLETAEEVEEVPREMAPPSEET
ncbi:tigger transposable element-derived protein 1-like [Macrobrachium rosenbergii]|uniref:tigger transposable element-derived protein 1-like n=1 Tax=Macrobrachium rosenbergii TaxID=79674 RepID=UPI0034D6E599